MKLIETFVFSLILLLIGFAAINIARAADPAVMHLKLDETVGATTSTDATSNGHDGAITGDITLGASGYDGTSYFFESLADAGAITIDDYDYGSDGNFAIKIHWKDAGDNNAGTSYRYLFSTGNWTTNHTLMMFIGEASLTADSGSLQNKLGFRLADSNDTVGGTYDNIIKVDVSDEVTDGEWHEVWFVAESGVGTKIYLDGELAHASTTRMGDAFDPGAAGSAGYESDMNIGWRPRTTTNRYHKGYIDDVKVYDFAFDPYGGDELEISSWTDKKIIQRVGTTADFDISGTYNSTTDPTAIEYRLIDPTTTTSIDSFDWATLDAAPADNYWEGTISDIPQGGWYKVQTRYSNDPDNTVVSSNNFGVGLVVGCTGQSNMVKFFTEITFTGDGDPDSVVDETPGEYVRRYGYGTPRVDENDAGQYSRPRTGDVFDYDWGDVTGNGAIRFANNLYDELDIPILLLDFGIDGSALGTNTYFYWIDEDDQFRDAFEAGITAAGGDIEILFWHNGYTDARDGTSSVYKTNLGTLYSQIDGLLPAERELKMILGVQNRGDYDALSCDEGDCGVAYNNIRKAQIEYADENDHAYSSGSTIDASIALDTFGRGDGHFYASQYEIMADRATHAVLQALGTDGEVGVRSPDISEAAYNGTNVTVAVDHQNGDTLQLLTAGDVEGFEVTPNDWETTWTMESGIDSASLVNKDKNVRLVLSETPTTTLKMRYLYGENVLSYKATAAERRNRGNFVYDNHAYHTGRTGLPLNNSTADITPTEDETAPVVSDLSLATSTATFTWTTDESASSKIKYGLTTDYNSSTTEADINTRVTSHSVTLSNLVECATYNYVTLSQDLAGNITTSTNATFVSDGCTGGEDPDDATSEEVTTAAGGTVELLDGTEGVALTIPIGYNENDATIQVHQLDSTTVLAVATAPDSQSAAGEYFYDFNALEDETTEVTEFDESITVTFTYQDSDVADIDESNIAIYRWNGSSWSILSNCSVDASANSISCTTTQFSVFALFGPEVAAASTSGGGIPTGMFDPPTSPEDGFKVWINNDQDTTDSRQVNLTFNAGDDSARIAISEDPDFLHAVQENFVDNKPWTLSVGDGLKNIYVKFFTQYGYASQVVSDSINLVLAQGLDYRLIKYNNNSKVYYLKNKIKQWIVDEATFFARGYHWSDVEIVSDNEIYETGQDIKLSNQDNNYQFDRYLHLGSIGEDVRELQTLLKTLGYFDYPSITGYYGPVTTQAVKDFQVAYDIDALGVVGP